MALSNRGKAIALGATLAGVLGLSYAAQKAKQRAKTPGKKTPTLEGVFELGARLPARVVNDVLPPIELSFLPRTMTLDGKIIDGERNIENAAQVGNLVTDITQERANIAYEYVLNLLGQEEVSVATPAERDAVIKRVVSVIAPRVDWSQGLSPYAYGQPESRVWVGVQLIVELANQSYFNKQALGGAAPIP